MTVKELLSKLQIVVEKGKGDTTVLLNNCTYKDDSSYFSPSTANLFTLTSSVDLHDGEYFLIHD